MYLKLTVLNCVIQWSLVHSQCCVSTFSFQNIFITLKESPVLIKQSFPIFPFHSWQPPVCFVSMDYLILDILYK